jgi:competence protein ComEA
MRLVHLPVSLAILLGLFFACASQSVATKKPPLHPINLNTASSSELQLVPGIGPATADKILQMRKSYGSFKSVDDLRAIKGIGPKRLEKMRKYITVGHAASPVKPGDKTSAPAAAKSPPKTAPKTPAQRTVVSPNPSDGEEKEPTSRPVGMNSAGHNKTSAMLFRCD